MNHAYKLKKEYSESGIPVIIADEELKILWKNNIGGLYPDLGESAKAVFGGGRAVTGLVTSEIGGEVCTFNVIKTEDGESGRFYYIIELIASTGLGGSVPSEAVRGYISHICSRIRAAADCIASVTDRLFDDISEGDFNAGLAAERFEQIYESVIGLERETAYPEIIYSLTDPKKSDDIIILDKEMIAVAEEIKSSLNGRQGSGGRVRISEDCDRDIFFHMNADSFETAVASMAAECCTAVCCPERIIFSARRSGRDRAEITVMSLVIGSEGSAGSVRGRRPFAYEDEKSFNRRLLSEYIYDVLRLKNGAMFSRESIPGGFVCRMNIEALPRGASVFAQKPVDGSDRLMSISDKVAFFFGDIFDMQAAGKRRYTFRSPVGEQAENDG